MTKKGYLIDAGLSAQFPGWWLPENRPLKKPIQPLPESAFLVKSAGPPAICMGFDLNPNELMHVLTCKLGRFAISGTSAYQLPERAMFQ